MTQQVSRSRFTTLSPDEVWKIYNNVNGIFRGGGGSNAPKLMRADGPRRTDLHIFTDLATRMEMVHPNSTMGLSFADSIEVLAKKKIEGWVWVIPKGRSLPEGLVFNVAALDHPLLNVGRVMSVLDMMARLTLLAEMMEPCNVKIDKLGKIVESSPGSLANVAKKW